MCMFVGRGDIKKMSVQKGRAGGKYTGPRQGGLTGTWRIYPSGSTGCIKAKETATERGIFS